MITIEINCYNCKHHKSMSCPNSSECYSLDNKPYFEPKEIECLNESENKMVWYIMNVVKNLKEMIRIGRAK